MKILQIIENRSAVAQIRLLSPMSILQSRGDAEIDTFVLDQKQTFEYSRINNCDVVIVQRTSQADTLEIMKVAKQRGKQVIYDIDDDLLTLPGDHPLYNHFNDESVKNLIIEHLELADLVTVSTTDLADSLAFYAKQITVVRNEIDLEIFPSPSEKQSSPITIGYAAGLTHEKDIAPIVPALERLLREYGDRLRLIFFWLIPESLKGHPQVEHLGGFPLLQDYAKNLHESRLDIGLAPLIDNTFNGAKSDVKYLEYGSQAVAGVYSKGSSFANVTDGKTGLIVAGLEPDAWYAAIKSLIDSEELRTSIGSAAYNDVRENRTAEKLADVWVKTITNLLYPEAGARAKPLASIVILTFNALDYTKECVESIALNTDYPHEIIFVDNASSDGTVDYLHDLAAKNQNYTVIVNDENRGFSGGNNQGVEAAKGDYVLLLNNDVLVGKHWLADLVAALEMHPNIGVVGPITNHISGRQVISDIPYTDTPGFYEFSAKVRTANRGKVTPRRRIAGFAMITRRTLYGELGGLDEAFGSGNYEDDDFCLRIAQKGLAVMVDEGTFIHHYGSKTFAANKIDYAKSLSKNEAIFKERWPEVDPKWLIEADGTIEEEHTSELEKAEAALLSRDLEGADALFSKVVAENPLSAEAHTGTAVLAMMRGDQGAARTSYQFALERDPDNFVARRGVANVEFSDENFDKARDHLVHLLTLNGDDFSARRMLASVLLSLEQFDEAIALLVGVTVDDPEDWEANLALASLYDEVENAEKVLEHAQVVLSKRPENKAGLTLREKYS